MGSIWAQEEGALQVDGGTVRHKGHQVTSRGGQRGAARTSTGVLHLDTDAIPLASVALEWGLGVAVAGGFGSGQVAKS